MFIKYYSNRYYLKFTIDNEFNTDNTNYTTNANYITNETNDSIIKIDKPKTLISEKTAKMFSKLDKLKVKLDRIEKDVGGNKTLMRNAKSRLEIIKPKEIHNLKETTEEKNDAVEIKEDLKKQQLLERMGKLKLKHSGPLANEKMEIPGSTRIQEEDEEVIDGEFVENK